MSISLTFLWHLHTFKLSQDQFSVPQIEYLLGGSSKKGSHVYFLLILAMVLLLWRQFVLLWHQVTMVPPQTTFISNYSITQKTCNRKYTWLPFLLLPPSGYSIWGTENIFSPNNNSRKVLILLQLFKDVLHMNILDKLYIDLSDLHTR